MHTQTQHNNAANNYPTRFFTLHTAHPFDKVVPQSTLAHFLSLLKSLFSTPTTTNVASARDTLQMLHMRLAPHLERQSSIHPCF